MRYQPPIARPHNFSLAELNWTAKEADMSQINGSFDCGTRCAMHECIQNFTYFAHQIIFIAHLLFVTLKQIHVGQIETNDMNLCALYANRVVRFYASFCS